MSDSAVVYSRSPCPIYSAASYVSITHLVHSRYPKRRTAQMCPTCWPSQALHQAAVSLLQLPRKARSYSGRGHHVMSCLRCVNSRRRRQRFIILFVISLSKQHRQDAHTWRLPKTLQVSCGPRDVKQNNHKTFCANLWNSIPLCIKKSDSKTLSTTDLNFTIYDWQILDVT